MDLVVSGELYQVPPFDSARPDQRRLNDIAFSGDGEPTMAKEFAACVARMAKLKQAKGLHDCKLVLITDATLLQAPGVVEGLELLMANQGEIWAKLDGGTEAYYREINRSRVPFQKILDNLLATARRWPTTIQTLFLEWKGQGPSETRSGRPTSPGSRNPRRRAEPWKASSSTPWPVPPRSPRPAPSRLPSWTTWPSGSGGPCPSVPVEVFYGPHA